MTLLDYLKSHKIKNNLTDRLDRENELKFQNEAKNFQLDQESKVRISLSEIEVPPSMEYDQVLLTIKNKNSFLKLEGSFYCLADNNRVIHSGVFRPITPEYRNESSNPYPEVIYASKENAYFIIKNSGIYRKDIDRRPPRLIMRLENAGRRFVVYSEATNRIVIKQARNFLVLNPKTLKIDRFIAHNLIENDQQLIIDCLLLQNRSFKIILLSSKADLTLMNLNLKSRENQVVVYDLGFEYEYCKVPLMTICSKNKFLMLEGSGDNGHPINYMLFELQEDSIIFRKYFEPSNGSSMGPPLFYDYFSGNRLIFLIKMERSIPGSAPTGRVRGRRRNMTVDYYLGVVYYNIEKNEVKVLDTEVSSLHPGLIMVREKTGVCRDPLLVYPPWDFKGFELLAICNPGLTAY